MESELLAERLQLKRRSLVELARRYGAPRKIKRKPWTEEEEALVEAYKGRLLLPLAMQLNRSIRSVTEKRLRLNAQKASNSQAK